MRPRTVVWLGLVVLGVGLATAVFTHGMGFTARATPSPLEARLLREVRQWGTPSTVRSRANPVAPTDDVLHEGMAHWADHSMPTMAAAARRSAGICIRPRRTCGRPRLKT
jgi:hypothetical protein